MIEKTRHNGLDRKYRLFLSKGISVIESELHFLFDCSAYNTARENIFGSMQPNQKDQIFFPSDNVEREPSYH